MLGWLTGSGDKQVAAPEIPKEKESCPVNPLNPTGIKPCCACPETKTARDDCFMKNDPDVATDACKELVAKHVACMKSYGFNI